MSKSLETSDFVKTLDISDIREKLAEIDLDRYVSDRDLFQVFLEGCTGWLNQSVEDCINEYIQYEYMNEDFSDESGNDITYRFFVTDASDKYAVVLESPFDITIYKNNIRIDE